MASIDIQTTQNVTISYELASLRDRIIAFVLDQFIIAIACLILISIVGSIAQTEDGIIIGMLGVVMPVYFLYTLLWESLGNGHSPGKLALKLKVIRLDGKQPLFIDYLLRWSFRMVDIWFTLGAVAIIMINTSRRGQRLGELMSNTIVVKSRPGMDIGLRDILSIKSIQDHEPKYPGIRAIREEDMLLVKQVIDRYQRFGNEAHRIAIHETAERLSYLLELDKTPDDKLKFLKDCIKDYIVLTR